MKCYLCNTNTIDRTVELCPNCLNKLTGSFAIKCAICGSSHLIAKSKYADFISFLALKKMPYNIIESTKGHIILVLDACPACDFASTRVVRHTQGNC